MTVKDSDIIQLALDKYLGREDQWCQRAWAKDHVGAQVDALGPYAVSRCAQSAIESAVYDLSPVARRPNLQRAARHYGATLSGELAEYFRETHPDIGEHVTHTPAFNDHPLMTYEGVRAAMEKYLAALQEQGR